MKTMRKNIRILRKRRNGAIIAAFGLVLTLVGYFFVEAGWRVESYDFGTYLYNTFGWALALVIAGLIISIVGLVRMAMCENMLIELLEDQTQPQQPPVRVMQPVAPQYPEQQPPQQDHSGPPVM